MVALEKICTAADVNHHWKKIVEPADQRRVELVRILLPALGEKPVGGNHLYILVIAASHEHVIRVGELETQQRINHLDAVKTPVRVVTKEHHIAVRLGQEEAVQSAGLVERIEHGDERVNIAMKIAMKDYLAAGWHLQLLCERLKRNRWPQEISPIGVEKLSRLRLAANPIRGGVHRANLEQLKRRPQRLGHLLKGG